MLQSKPDQTKKQPPNQPDPAQPKDDRSLRNKSLSPIEKFGGNVPTAKEIAAELKTEFPKLVERYAKIVSLVGEKTSDGKELASHMDSTTKSLRRVLNLQVEQLATLQSADWVLLNELVFETHIGHMTDHFMKLSNEAVIAQKEFGSAVERVAVKFSNYGDRHDIKAETAEAAATRAREMRSLWRQSEDLSMDLRILARDPRNAAEAAILDRIEKAPVLHWDLKESRRKLADFLSLDGPNSRLIVEADTLLGRVRAEHAEGTGLKANKKGGTGRSASSSVTTTGPRPEHCQTLDQFELRLQRRFEETVLEENTYSGEELAQIRQAVQLGIVSVQSKALSVMSDTEVPQNHEHLFLLSTENVLSHLDGDRRKAVGEIFAIQAVALGVLKAPARHIPD